MGDQVISWLKKIDRKLDAQNGRVTKNEQAIKLINQRHELEQGFKKEKKKILNRMEDWSRKKFIVVLSAVISAILAVAGAVFLYILKSIIQNLR